MKKVPRMYNKNRPENIINKFDRTGFISLFAMSLKFFFYNDTTEVRINKIFREKRAERFAASNPLAGNL